MYPTNMPPDMWPSGTITYGDRDALIHFLEYNTKAESGVKEEKPKKPKTKTWEEKVEEERDNNLRGLFGYD